MVTSELGWSSGVGQDAGTRTAMLSVGSGHSYLSGGKFGRLYGNS